jgi:hypothetical protein
VYNPVDEMRSKVFHIGIVEKVDNLGDPSLQAIHRTNVEKTRLKTGFLTVIHSLHTPYCYGS